MEMVMKITGLIFLLTASQAMADDRILQEPAVPAWCKEDRTPSGNCVRGPKDYELIAGKVRWVDKDDPNDPLFWQRQDRDKFGSDTTGSSGGGQGGGGAK